MPSENKEAQEMKIDGKTIFKQKKYNTWYTRYRKNGKQYFISGKTQKEVAEKLKDALDIKRRENLPYNTFEKWYNQWLELFKVGKVKDSTIYQYNSLLAHIPETFKIQNIKNISALEIQKLINNVSTQRTAQKLFEFLSDIFKSALRFNIIKTNPMTVLDKPKHSRENHLALTPSEQQVFINQCLKEKYGDMFLVCMYLGLRRGELLAITGNDIEEEYLNINKSFNDFGEFDTTKNSLSIRKVPLFENVKIILEKYKHFGNERIFKIANKTAHNKFKDILKNAGLNETKFSIHSLRHTFITNCKNENIPEHIIQQWVGHQIGSKVTSTVYTHAQSDVNLLYINKLNQSELYSNNTHKK